MITQAGGNIGIGTTTPAATLDVVGGNVNLEASTATSGNMLKGGVPFLHNYGDVNTFLGLSAGNLTTTGFRNTGSGWNALYNNTAGNNNTASGSNALYSNTAGFNNTANGVNALCFNTTGYNNTTIGAAALFSNDTGFENTAIGDRADVQGNLFNATAIGVGAIVNASNKIRLGNFDVTVVEDSP